MPSMMLGVDLGGTKVRAALVDPGGKIAWVAERPTEAERGYEAVVAAICGLVRGGLGAHGGHPEAVGVGVAGQVEGRSGRVRSAPNLRWLNVDLAGDLSRALRLPVYVTNDVRAAAWGEWSHGAGEGRADMICLFVGTGVGGGVVSGGRMLEGANNTAGELGHTVLLFGGRKCSCPGRGCLEAYVGGWAIAERAREAAAKDARGGAALMAMAGDARAVTAKHVAQLAAQGDGFCRALMKETAEYLATGLAGMVNAFSPSVVVLGGGVVEGSPSLLEEVARSVPSLALAAAARGVLFAKARLGPDSGVVGAAAMARHRLAES